MVQPILYYQDSGTKLGAVTQYPHHLLDARVLHVSCKIMYKRHFRNPFQPRSPTTPNPSNIEISQPRLVCPKILILPISLEKLQMWKCNGLEVFEDPQNHRRWIQIREKETGKYTYHLCSFLPLDVSALQYLSPSHTWFLVSVEDREAQVSH